MSDAAPELVYRGHGQAEIVAAIEVWIRRQSPELAATTISSFWHPTHDGFSNVTLVLGLDERASEDAPATPSRVAVRLANEHPLYDSMSLRRQYDDQVRLRSCGLPVPEMRWFGTDDPVLGPEFYAMAAIEGEIPSDLPSYHAEGWMLDLSPAQRTELWWDALDHVVALHRIDPDTGGFDFDPPADPADAVAARLAERHEQLDRLAGPDELGTIRRALAWLARHAPAPQGPRRLCWGDARLPNMSFVGSSLRAMLDWEGLYLGWPEFDLAWFIYMDAISATQSGVARLDGLPDPDATVARWSEGTGLEPEALHWATVFSAVELATGYANAFATFAAPEQRSETLASLEEGPIFTDLTSRLS